MEIQQWNKTLKHLIIVLFIILAISTIAFKLNPCDKCKFRLDGDSLNIKEFMDLYQEKCFGITKEMFFKNNQTINITFFDN